MKYKLLLWMVTFILLVSFASADLSSDAVVFTSLANYSESTGLVDLASYTLNSTAYNGASLSSDGSAFSFDGSNDYVEAGDLESVLGTNPATWSYGIWFQIGSTTVKKHFMTDYTSNSGADPVYAIDLTINGGGNNGKIGARIDDNVVDTQIFSDGATRYDDGNWHHAVVTIDRTDQMILYVDGVNVSSDYIHNGDYMSSPILRYGVVKYNNNFIEVPLANLSDAFVTNTVLNASYVAELYSNGRNYEYFTPVPSTASNITFSSYRELDNSSISGVNYSIDGVTASSFSLSPGNYTVTAITNGFYSETKSFTVEASTNKTVIIDTFKNNYYGSIPSVYSIGASITAGHLYYDPDPSFYVGDDPVNNTYQYALDIRANTNASGINSSGYGVYNLGVGSETCDQVNARLNSIPDGTNFVIYSDCNANDLAVPSTPSEIIADYEVMYTNLSGRVDKIIVFTVFPYDYVGRGRPADCADAKTINEWLRSNFSQRSDVILSDVAYYLDNNVDECVRNSSLFDDYGHPNQEGYDIAGSALWASLGFPSYPNINSLSNGLVACYSFEQNGSDYLNRYDAAVTNGVYLATGSTGYALNFSGNGSTFAVIPDSSNDPFDNTDGLSIHWSMLTYDGYPPTSTGRIFDVDGVWDIRASYEFNNELRTTFTTIGSNSANGLDDALDYGVSHDWAVTWQQNEKINYRDGVQTSNETAGDAGSTLHDDSNPLYIGIDSNEIDYPFNGYLDEVKIYNRVLNETEIIALQGLTCADLGATPYVPQDGYYFSNSGNDSASCSFANPCKTITKLNTLDLEGNNTIFFNGGDTWFSGSDAYINVESGTVSGNVTYTSYGTGQAVITGSINASVNTSFWSVYSGNVYEYYTSIGEDVGNVIFDNGASYGYYETSLGAVDTEGDYYWDDGTGTLYLYSAANPATTYSTIDIALDDPIFDIRDAGVSNEDYVVISNLALKYSASHAVYISKNSSFIYVLNNTITDIGGDPHNGGRRGNGLEVWEEAHDIYAAYNLFTGIWDVALTAQGYANATAYNLHFYNNTILNSTYGWELIQDGEGSNYTNVLFNHNTILNGGTFWGGVQREETIETIGPVCLRYGKLDGIGVNVNVTNNLCQMDFNNYGYTYELVHRSKDMSASWVSNLNEDYNLFYINTTPIIVWREGDGGSSYNTLTSFSSATGQDVNSVWEDVRIVNIEGGDYRPWYNSLACTSSSTGDVIGAYECQTTDYFKVILDSGTGVYLDWNNGTTLINATGSNLTTSIGYVDNNTLVNFTLYKTNYFNISVSDWNISADYTFNYTIYPFVNASDSWDDDPIIYFNISIDGVNYSSNASGIVYVPFNSSKNYIIYAEDYISNSNTHDFTGQTYLAAQMYQSIISFNSSKIYSGEAVVGVTYTISGDTSNPKNLSVGNYDVTATKAGYYTTEKSFTVTALDNKTVTVELYDSIINLSAKERATNDSINNFNGWIYHNDSATNFTFSTTNGTFYVPNSINESFYLVVKASGYNTETYTITPNSTVFNYTSYHDIVNTLIINIYNDTSTDLLTNNVSVYLIHDLVSQVNYTSTGQLTITNIEPDDYEIRFYSYGYLNTSQFFTMDNGTTQYIDMYLQLDTSQELQRFMVIDQVGDVVSGAIIRLQVEVPGFTGLWQTVDEKSTNTDGETGFYVYKSTSTFYRMIVIYDGTVELISDKTLFLPGVTDIISLQIDLSAASQTNNPRSVYTNLNFSGSNNETVLFEWVDPNSSIIGGELIIMVEDFNLTGVPPSELYRIQLNSTDGSLNYTLPVVNDTKFTIIGNIIYGASTELAEQAIKIFGNTIFTDKNLGLLIAAIVIIFVAFITISLKPLFSSLISLSLIAVLNAFNIISIATTIITSLIGLAVIFFIKIKRSD